MTGIPERLTELEATFKRVLDDESREIDERLRVVIPLAEEHLAEIGEGQEDDYCYLLYLLSMSHLLLFDLGQDSDDFHHRDSAIELFHELREWFEPGLPPEADCALWLGMLLAQRFLADIENRSPDVDEAIEALGLGLRRAEDIPPETEKLGHPWLGLLHLYRFLYLAGDENDHRTATEELENFVTAATDNPQAADFARVLLASLALSHHLSAGLRNEPFPDTAIPEGYFQAFAAEPASAAAGRKALEHLGACSPETLSEPTTAALVLHAKAVAADGIGGVSREDLEQIKDTLALGMDEELSGSPIDNLRTILHALTESHLAGGPGESDDEASERLSQSMEQLLDLLPATPNEAMGALTRDALGALVSSPLAHDAAPRDLAASMALFRRALDELDERPAQLPALMRLTFISLFQAVRAKSTETLTYIHDVLQEKRTKSSENPLEAAVLPFLLGWTESFRGEFESEVAHLDAAIGYMREAAEAAPEGHQLRSMTAPMLIALLTQRYSITHNLEDLDALSEVAQLDDADPRIGWIQPVVKLYTDLLRANTNVEDLDFGPFTEAIEKVPAADRTRLGLDKIQRMTRALQDMADMFSGVPPTGSRLAALRETVEEAARSSDGMLDWTAENGNLLVGAGYSAGDPVQMDRGIAVLAEVSSRPSDMLYERMAVLNSLALAYRMKYDRWRNRQDLDNAIVTYEEARLLILREPGLPDGAATLHSLGESLFLRGDRNRRDGGRAVSAGLAGLRARLQEVLIQTGPERALVTARKAEGEALETARWCVAENDYKSAVLALETGRALVLHSATSEADTAGLLRAAGHDELAERWSTQLGADVTGEVTESGIRIPDNLRHEVMRAIDGTETERTLLDPLSRKDLAEAMKRTDTTATVFLVPPHEESPAFAITVPADGPVRRVPLPLLTLTPDGPVERFEKAQRELHTASSGGNADAGWDAAAAEFSRWSWRCVVEPVLTDVRASGSPPVPRIVLVPAGSLGGLPWHAAGRLVDGVPRYACQDAQITYAASASQFAGAAGRGHRAWTENPSVVAVTGNLPWVKEETAEIARAFYSTVPTTSSVRPATIRALLPRAGSSGASLLHLSCHANRAEPPIDSYLVLSNEKRLTVRDILRQAAHRPEGEPGGLIVLASCMSDLTPGAHDEALTLATALMAGGAAGVLGTRWPVDDLHTALFMVVFHHYLNSGYPSPSAALRAAQSWMLDPARLPPPKIGGLLAEEFALADPSSIRHWAAFTYQGL